MYGQCGTGKYLVDGKIKNLDDNWAVKNSGKYVRSLQGKDLSEEMIAKIPLQDRRLVCGYAKRPCSLVWYSDEHGNGWGVCKVEDNACDTCVYTYEEPTCRVKNLCSGVICP